MGRAGLLMADGVCEQGGAIGKAYIRIRSKAYQQLRCFREAFLGDFIKERQPIIAGPVGVRAMLEQQAQGFVLGLACGGMEGSFALLIMRIRVRACGEKQLHDGGVAGLGGDMQGRSALRAWEVRAKTVFEQDAHYGGMPQRRRDMQRRTF